MAKITEEMKAMVKGQQAYVATATPDGVPCVAPKGTVAILDDEHIIYSEIAGKHTWENVQKNPKVAIIAGDISKMQCLRFSGPAEIITEGELVEKGKAQMEKMGMPAPKAVIKVKVEEIYDCGVPAMGKKLD